MGLDKLRDSGKIPIMRLVSAWRLPLTISLAGLSIGILGDAGRQWLRYDRSAIGDGEVWRVFTAHFTHLGFPHLLMNLAGLALIWLLVGRHYRQGTWLVVVAICMTGVVLGFWFIDAGLNWYVGLSGLLHGMLIAGAIAGLRTQRTESIVILVFVFAKLMWEQLMGPLPGSEASAGGNVIVNAHLYGALAGAVAATLCRRSALDSAAI